MNNDKIGAAIVYNKGNELMDKVGFLKKPLHKKIVWGVLCILALLMVGRIFGCGGGSNEDLIINGCKGYITQRYGKDSLKEFEVVDVQINENRAILKADVNIHDPGSIAPVRDAFDAVGTAVFYLEEREDGLHVVDFELQ